MSANIVFVATVSYFTEQPFDGFAGFYNLVGLLVINLIFIAIIFAVYRDNKTNILQQSEQRNALKKRRPINTCSCTVPSFVEHVDTRKRLSHLQSAYSVSIFSSYPCYFSLLTHLTKVIVSYGKEIAVLFDSLLSE
jgi:cbb3-type cytochrome oxidase subunit 3